MKAMKKIDSQEATQTTPQASVKKLKVANQNITVEDAVENSWAKIAPFWPLKNLIAVNPIAGFEDLAFEDALTQAQAYFQQNDLPAPMQNVNRESIKWLQAYFDNGQSTIRMPMRRLGFLQSIRKMLEFDGRLDLARGKKRAWLKNLPVKPDAVIAECLSYLAIKSEDHEIFLTLMLTTLPGWAAHIQYRTEWADATDAENPHGVSKQEYLALRLILTCLLWSEGKALLDWHDQALARSDAGSVYKRINDAEHVYAQKLTSALQQQSVNGERTAENPAVDAQMVFCIDVRSEPFRRSVEAQGNYETLGFAGFFGVPVAIENAVTGESHASCPVLLKPAHHIVEHPECSVTDCQKGHRRLQGFKKLYQSVKYTFTSPFALVETLGVANGVWMGVRSFSPKLAAAISSKLKKAVHSEYDVIPDIESISFEQKTAYASGALKMMGLTKNFAPLVIFCGHGSTTQNNAYATALDCGACGGRHGAPNARILAAILNQENVREALKIKNINIPATTYFTAAEHNTTTDHVQMYDRHVPQSLKQNMTDLKNDLEAARAENSLWRSIEMGVKDTGGKSAARHTAVRSQDWAQVRPEWGLARNAAFIVAPRSLTRNIDLEGRSFLHSYDWEQDQDGSSLTTILTAPMVVAQWINSQYLFSTLDNVAFGGGSKITKNITGKIGIMQGNASDLMHGLPLQSVNKNDDEAYHEPMRLTVIVNAPRSHIDPVISAQPILQKLFGNGWVTLICLDPADQEHYTLQRNFAWEITAS